MVLERLNLNVNHFENKIMFIFYNYKPVSYKQTSAVRKYETIYLEYPLYNYFALFITIYDIFIGKKVLCSHSNLHCLNHAEG